MKDKIDETVDVLNEQVELNFDRVAKDIVRVYKPTEYRGKKLKSINIRNLFDNPIANSRQLQNISNYMFTSGGSYMRIIRYLSTMMTNDVLLTPYDIPRNPDRGKMLLSYYKSAKYLEKIDYKYEMIKAKTKLMIDGEYFFYILESSDHITFMELPKDYCRLAGYESNVGIVEFDFTYFTDKNDPKLLNYPSEFKSKYHTYINSKNIKNRDNKRKIKRGKDTEIQWLELSSDAVCLSMFPNQQKSYPPLAGLFEDIIELDDYKDLTKSRTELDNYSLIHMKSPFKKDPKSWKDALIPLDKLKIFFNNTKKNTPKQVGVCADFLDYEQFDFNNKTNEIDRVASAERNVYSSAGVSSLLFNNEKASAQALVQSIIADKSWMIFINIMFENLLKREIKKVGNGAYNWRASFVDSTHFDKMERIKLARENATFGTSAFMIWALDGFSPMETLNMLEWESISNIKKNMIPLSSSHTQSGDVGAKVKDNPTDNTEKSREQK